MAKAGCLKLAIVTETFPPEINGVAMTFGTLADKLAAKGHSLTILRPQRRDLSRLPKGDARYRVVTFPGFGIPGYPALRMGFPAWGRLRRLWENDRPDLVHVVTEGPLGASAVSVARSMRIPVTSSYHTHFHSYASHYGIRPVAGLTLAWLRRLHNRTQATFAPTLELCSELDAKGFKGLQLLSRGIDLEQFRPQRRSLQLRAEWGAGASTPVVLHVGRMAPEKNYPLLFRLFEAMRMANPALRFVLAGEGPLRESLQRAHPECRFLGFMERSEIGRVFASCDIYIHASSTETFGNVVTEAMASGLAVAGYDYAAAREFIRDGDNGLLAPFGDEQALHLAARRLASDADLREKLASAAPAALRAQGWDQVVDRFEAELLAIAGKGVS